MYHNQDEWETNWPVEVKLETDDVSVCDLSQTVIKDDLPNGSKYKHEKVNDTIKEYECFDCDFHTLHLSQLKRHIRNSHLFSKSSSSSLKCDDVNGFLDDLNRDIAKFVGNSNTHACKLCPYKTPFLSNLKQHLYRHTAKIQIQTCEICGRCVSSKSDLKKHMRTHTGEKPFTCSLCDYSASSSTSLRMHIAKHTGDRPYGCELCDYRTARRGDLASHMLSHSQEKPYSCPCGFRTARPAHLKRHMAIHNGNRPFACMLCNNYFSKMSDLEKHIKAHSGGKSYLCPCCNYRTQAQATLTRHLRTKHPDNDLAIDDTITAPYLDCDETIKTPRTRRSRKKKHMNPPPEVGIIGSTHFLCSVQKVCFICFHCDFRTDSLSTLRLHIISQHSGGDWKLR